MSNTNNGPSGDHPLTPIADFRKATVPTLPPRFSAPSPSGRPSATADGKQGITPASVLNALRQWWKVAMPLGLVLAAVSGAAVYFLFEPEYEAAAWLRIDQRAPYIAFPDRQSSAAFIETQKELIRSPLVLGPVVGRPEIASLPEIQNNEAVIPWLARNVNVSSVGRSELFRISYVGKDPEDSALLVNAVLDEYFALRGQTDAEQTQRVIELLEQERERRAQEVNRLRETVRTLTQQTTGVDPFAARPAVETAPLHPLAELQSRLANAEVDREILQARVKAFQEWTTQEPPEVPDAVVEAAVEARPEVRAQKDQLAAMRVTLREFEEKLRQGVDDPAYRKLDNEIQQGEESLDELRTELRGDMRKEMAASLAVKQNDELAEMEAQLASFDLMTTLLHDRCEAELKNVEQFSGDTLELEFARADLGRAEQVFELIASRVVELRTEQRAPDRITLLQRAAVPTLATSFPVKQTALAILVSFFAPFGLAVVWEQTVRRVSDAEQLEGDVNLAVVGEVARLPVRTTVRRESSSGRVARDLDVFEESIDTLRTCLVLSEPLKDMRVLAVTSSANREGKTSVAVQLAVSIARATGQPTLLIDGDMRAPDVHNVLGIDLEPGLGEVLAKKCSLKDAIVTSWSDSVHLLPAGKLHASPHKLLGNGVVGSIFEEVRSLYRYVIVDTPPILAAGEALVLARAADASLLCAMRDVSRVNQVRKTHQRLVEAGAHPIGIVLNGVPTKRYSYRYGSYGYARSW